MEESDELIVIPVEVDQRRPADGLNQEIPTARTESTATDLDRGAYSHLAQELLLNITSPFSLNSSNCS